jgi:hypothetical protein
MKTQMILFSAWLNSNPTRIRTIGTATAIALALLATLSPQAAVLAGPAGGGSH